jgi:imidazolonepropionase
MVTLSGNSQVPKIGKQMRDIGIIRDGALAIREGKIVAVGKTVDLMKAFRGEYVVSAKGKTVLPGFVDSHTHLVFAGSREDEFEMLVEGASFMDILRSGDAIMKTARETHRTRVEKLVELGLERVDVMLAHGTTTVEAKSGYGQTAEDEIKILNATKRLNQLHSANIVSTFMGAHAVPLEYRKNADEYVDIMTEEAMPRIVQLGLAEFCDVFCDRGMFTLEQSKRFLTRGKQLGLKPKIHADHMSVMGGTDIAADMGAVSADHLNYTSAEGAKALAKKGVAGTLLPAATYSMMMDHYPNARLMIDSGVPVALGTDFSSNNWVLNMQLVISMACHFMHMTPAEAIAAATINAAHAICRAGEVGSLEVGKRGDLTVLNAPNHRFLGFSSGVNLVDKVIADGRLVVDREKQDEPVFLSKTD